MRDWQNVEAVPLETEQAEYGVAPGVRFERIWYQIRCTDDEGKEVQTRLSVIVRERDQAGAWRLTAAAADPEAEAIRLFRVLGSCLVH